MPSIQHTLSVEQLHVASRVARELREAFPVPVEGLAAVALLLGDAEVSARKPQVAPKIAVVIPRERVRLEGLFWSRGDGFYMSEPPPPPTHFVAYGDDEGPIACLGLTKFPDGIEFSDQWTPNAVLRAFQKVHGELWDDAVQVAIEPPSTKCFCGGLR